MRNCLFGLLTAVIALGFSTPNVSAQSKPSAKVVAETLMADKTSGEQRALLILQDHKVVAEFYAKGYAAETRFVSWSMAKTVTAMALGILVDAGKLQLDAPAPVPGWPDAKDGREKITLRHLLTMTAGLQHQEGSEDGKPVEQADTVRILFSDAAQSMIGHASNRPMVAAPGTLWKYSTATTHILSDIITNAVTTVKDPLARRKIMAAWFAEKIWRPAGITTAEWDFDNAGLFLGGSMLHMTTRDWARVGQLLLDRGKASYGQRVFSEAWMGVLTTKAAAANNNHYAGQLWLNTGPATGQDPVLFHPRGGDDTFSLIGHLGQYVVVAPSRQAIVVRLGKSTRAERAIIRERLGDMVEALPKGM